MGVDDGVRGTHASFDDPSLTAVCCPHSDPAVSINYRGVLSKSRKGKRISDLNATLVRHVGTERCATS
ncbi:hypothetical protein BDV34DRAFT_162381 [Aspergillus parasiticus]|uniref:Uncharacterized protein n=1 Tax=Aspergillus parasiticus TaxID=5067 RepID=A0A5N6D959_ASPPA|nr:hypothetical protein BDV34DRAFT_162381 [Aspergillus parasiticus]